MNQGIEHLSSNYRRRRPEGRIKTLQATAEPSLWEKNWRRPEAMNSLFGIFDAFHAELLRQKASANPSPSTTTNASGGSSGCSDHSSQGAMHSDGSERKGDEIEKAKRHPKEEIPRSGLSFAPESDTIAWLIFYDQSVFWSIWAHLARGHSFRMSTVLVPRRNSQITWL